MSLRRKHEFGASGTAGILKCILTCQKAQQDQCLLLGWCRNPQEALTLNKQLILFSLWSPAIRNARLDAEEHIFEDCSNWKALSYGSGIIPNGHSQRAKGQWSILQHPTCSSSTCYSIFLTGCRERRGLKLPSLLSLLFLLFVRTFQDLDQMQSHKVQFFSVNYLTVVMKTDFKNMNWSFFPLSHSF